MKSKFSLLNKGFLALIMIALVIGFITGQKISANECDNPEAADAGCTNDAYMGAKWTNPYVRVYLGEAHDATVKSVVRNAMSHFNSNQTHIDFYEQAPVIAKGYIKITDDNYAYETWTANADGSWFGGWPVDASYDSASPINIRFNLLKFPGTDDQENGTARHELGHSIGLGHKSDIATLMYCSRSRTAKGLTAADKTTLDVIY